MDHKTAADQNQQLQQHAARDLAKRSLPGCFIYFLIWLAIILPNQHIAENQKIFLVIGALFLGLGTLRLILALNFGRIYSRNRRAWQILFTPIVLLPAIGWGTLCSLSFFHPVFEPYSLATIIATSGLAGFGAAAFAPSRLLSTGLLAAFLLQPICTLLILGYANISILLIFTVLFIAISIINHMQHKEYWKGITNSFLLKQHAADLEHTSTVDTLTGLKNRGYFDTALHERLKSAIRSQSYISLLLLDIDHFKHINDHFGHLVGDECLRQFAQLITRIVKRETDVVARFGGQEFAIILSDMDKKQTLAMGKRIRKAVESMSHTHQGTRLSFTTSIGITNCIPQQWDTSDHLLEQSDKALNNAKDQGRNRVVFYDPFEN